MENKPISPGNKTSILDNCTQNKFYNHFAILGGEPVLLSSGIHSFPFKLGLPLGLPSTFLGKHGWVQYFCKVWNYSDLFLGDC